VGDIMPSPCLQDYNFPLDCLILFFSFETASYDWTCRTCTALYLIFLKEYIASLANDSITCKKFHDEAVLGILIISYDLFGQLSHCPSYGV
jgi:hypothetical protein